MLLCGHETWLITSSEEPELSL